jgi:hypothetical protein
MSLSQSCNTHNEALCQAHHTTKRSLVVVDNGVTYTKYFDEDGTISHVEVEKMSNDNELQKMVRTVKGFWRW